MQTDTGHEGEKAAAERGHLEQGTARGLRTHVVLLDGTMSTLDPGRESNIGLIYKLLLELPLRDRPSIFYEEGIQWDDWAAAMHVMTGTGINRQIRRAYGFLAMRYHPGDRILLLGYSRGAFAVRSLAGTIDRIGLLKSRFATERMIRQMYRHYRNNPAGSHAQAFARRFCEPAATIEMVGVFDTVKALGWPFPLLWRLSEPRHSFHSSRLGRRIRFGYQALAINEKREVFSPLLWKTPQDWPGQVEQVWFRGNHGDIGGHLDGFNAARPLSNIPLVWMLGKAETCGLTLPEGWRTRFPRDADAPSLGSWRGWSKIFPVRRERQVGQDPSESLHPTAIGASAKAVNLPIAEVGEASAAE